MLLEIKSNIFRDKAIEFHKGLNVVLGDNQATNSIGKTNLLLIIDFIFGGSSYISHSKDVIKNLGEHEFYFSFYFDKKYFFKRGTLDSKKISKCNESYEHQETISLDDFCKFLQEKYHMAYKGSTFRDLVSCFIRIWGKSEDNTKEPLRASAKETNKASVDRVIKLFDKYGDILHLSEKEKNTKSEKDTIKNMYNFSFAQKLTKKSYEKNLKNIDLLEKQIKEIQQSISTRNEHEKLSEENLLLISELNKLKNQKFQLERNIERLNFNISNDFKLSKKTYDNIEEYFPTVNKSKLARVDTFHKKLAKILRKNIKEDINASSQVLLDIEKSIIDIDDKIKDIDNADNPLFLKLAEKIKEKDLLEKQNETFNKDNELKDELDNLKSKLIAERNKICPKIQDSINEQMQEISKRIYGKDNSPNFAINEDKYSFEKSWDKGTGTAYVDLITFDLAILNLTNLPILVHDLPIFKNIQIERIEKIIKEYNSYEKQIFIALDETSKYTSIKNTLEKKKIIELDKNNTLFTKTWSSKK
ncbi:DUF2326 domain-containing protein [Francisella philomiragia]|uniref:DUF2326 domain-containing protein n=1 Tax=Francisella philomiragia TaxID=28110 RepID=A0A0B6D6F4_9GAMM|nr:DUF2326 domain-containing protein [Francisella philomiragia]AJI53862.1 hypothetical protein LA55_757 [Francisella philomiragia]